MNRILEYDKENLTLLVEPGLVTSRISETVEADGLFYPPDPSSMKVATIGGNVAYVDSGKFAEIPAEEWETAQVVEELVTAGEVSTND